MVNRDFWAKMPKKFREKKRYEKSKESKDNKRTNREDQEEELPQTRVNRKINTFFTQYIISFFLYRND